MKRFNRQGSVLFVRGIDKSMPAEHIKENAVSDCENVFIDRGLIKQRSGATTFGDNLSERIMEGRTFSRGGTDYTTAITLTKLKLYASGSDTWTDKTGVSDLTGTADDPIDTAVPVLSGNRILVFTNGIDNIKKFDGTNDYSDLGGSPPQAQYVTYYKTYTVVADITDDGGDAFPMRVQWSDTGAPETWSGGNSGSINLNEEGNPITGLNVFSNFLTVHKKDCIYIGYLVSNDNIFQFDRRSATGTIANNTIKELPNGNQIYLAKDGIRVFNGNQAKLVASEVSDVLKNIAPEYVSRCWGKIVKKYDEYWVGVPMGSQTDPETIYKYNYTTGSVYKDVRSNATCMLGYEKTSSQTIGELSGTIGEQDWRYDDEILLNLFPANVYGTSTGQAYEISSQSRNDGSTAIESKITTKDFTPDDRGQLARWLKVELFARGDTIRVEYSTDRGSTWTEVYDSPITLSNDLSTDSSPLIGYFDTMGSQVRFRFSNLNADETFELMQFFVGYRPREIRR